MTGPSSERTADAEIRENVHHLARGCRSDMYHDPTRYEQTIRAALDRLVACNQQLQEALAAAVKAYDSLLQAERDDAEMGYPLAGDSCLAAAMGLGADETFEKARAALASVRARTPA